MKIIIRVLPELDQSKYSLIVLQLKSTQDESAFSDLTGIISKLKIERAYKIRGHEIHQLRRNIERRTLKERAHMVSSFCSRNELEYITYHVPVSRNEGHALIDERSNENSNDAILATLKEAELVHKESGLESKVVIVHHLPSVVGFREVPYLDSAMKFQILENAEGPLLDLYRRNSDCFSSFAILTLENVFPKYFTNTEGYATINMFHPLEMVRLREYGIGVTFDLSHYNIYSNYLSYGKGNVVGDLDRQIYGNTAPSWNDCIDLFGESLQQLHVSGGKGADFSGEGLILSDGEIPIIAILTYAKHGGFSNVQVKHDSLCARNRTVRNDRVIRATIELREGHLYNGKLQRTAVEWLLTHAENVFW